MLRAPSPSWSSLCEAFLEETAEDAPATAAYVKQNGTPVWVSDHEHELEPLQLRALALAPRVLEPSSQKKRAAGQQAHSQRLPPKLVREQAVMFGSSSLLVDFKTDP